MPGKSIINWNSVITILITGLMLAENIWPGTVGISFRCRTEFPSHKNTQEKNYSVNGNWSFAITLILYLAPALIIPQSLLRQKIWFETKEAFVSNE